MLRNVKDACTLHETALDYQVAVGVEKLAQVIDAHDQGHDFIDKNLMTAGMEDLLAQGFSQAFRGNPAMCCSSFPKPWVVVKRILWQP